MAEDFGNQLALMNPAAAAAIRKQMYAQQLLQSGSDVSPVRSPWAAAARAVQGALGGYMMQGAQSDLMDINKQQQDEAKQFIFGPGSGVGAGGLPGAGTAPAPAAPVPAPALGGSGQGATGSGQGAPAPAVTATPGALPPAPELTPIVAPGGAKISVAAPYADRFQGLVNDLDAAGYKIDPGQTGGFNSRMIAGTNTPSQHASGAAIDVNWTSNARGGQGDIPPELARSLAAKYGLTWGGDWSGNTRDPMHFEVAQANRVGAPSDRTQLASSGGGSVIDAAATPGPGGGAGGAAPGAPAAPAAAPGAGFQRAMELRKQAQLALTSTNPYIRAQAPMLMQQATALMTMDSWSPPVQMPNGQFMSHNATTGATAITGADDKFEKADNGDLINMRTRQVIAKGGNYTQTGTSASGQPIYSSPGHPPVAVGEGPGTYEGPDGGIYDKATRTLVQPNPGWTPVGPAAGGGTEYRTQKGEVKIVESAARPDIQFGNTISTINTKIKSGQALTQPEIDTYTTAYNHEYPFTQKWNADQKAWTLVQEKPPGGNVISPQDLPLPGVKPNAQTAGLVKPPAAPTVTQPAQNVRTQELTTASVGKQMEEDFKKANTDVASASDNRSILGETATIRALKPDVRTGYGAEAQAHLGSILKSLGASDEDLQTFMGQNPSSAEALQKLFLKQSSAAVRQMGAREPGSVISMFTKAYPSLASQPGTIDMISRLIDMDQYYKDDRAQAKLDYLNNHRATIANPTDYRGEQGFRQSWDTQNDPRAYVGAAMAAAGQPQSVWAKQLSPAQQQQALQLVHRWNDVTQVMGEDANGKPKPYLIQKGNP